MDFITQTLNGLGLGSIYALVALGYSMVYGIVQLINFAHGDIIMVGGYVLYLVLVNLGEARGHEIALVAESIRTAVKDRFGIEIMPEVKYVG